MYHPVIAIVKGDGAYILVSCCNLYVVEWKDCTIKIGKKDALWLCFQRLREWHLES